MKVQYKVFEDFPSSVYSRVQQFCRLEIEKGHDPEDNLEIYPNGINPNVNQLPDVIYSNLKKAAEDGGCKYRQYGIHYGPGSKLFNTH